MSMYGYSLKNMEKNDLYNAVRDFLKTHKISELLEIITDVLYEKEGINE